MRGSGENVASRRRLHHAALFHHDDLVAIGGGEAKIVRDENGRHATITREVDQQVHHRLLRSDVEASRGLIRDQQFRSTGQREGDDHALAHAAGQLERVGVIALFWPLDPHLQQGLDGFLARVARARAGVLAQHILDLMADLAYGIERRARILENHRHFAPPQVAELAFRRMRQVQSGKRDGALRDAARAIENSHDRVGGHRLPRAGFADNAHRLALGDGYVDALNRRDDAAPRGEFNGQAGYVEERYGAHVGTLTCVGWGRRYRAIRRR